MVQKGEKSDLPQSFANRPKKGPGRPRTPALFLEWSDAAAACVVACAMKKIPPGFEHIESIEEFANDSPLAMRKDAAIHILDRRYGKPREHVESEGLDALSLLARALLEPGSDGNDDDTDLTDTET